MTIINKEYIYQVIKNNRKYKKLILYLKCDECQIEYICPENTKNRSSKQKNHFCSKQCTNKSMSNGKLREKVRKTCMEKYGCESFIDSDYFKQKREENCIKNYGVKNHFSRPDVREKIKKTCMEKYGSETFAGTSYWEAKLDRQDIAQKAWKTKIKNQKIKNISSRHEERMFKILCEKFGLANVYRGKKLFRQFIDFYINPLKIYIQVDGVYWHGLNRKINDIKKLKTRQDHKILKQIERDVKLNKYCKKNNLTLIRITDEKIDLMSNQEIINVINNNKSIFLKKGD